MSKLSESQEGGKFFTFPLPLICPMESPKLTLSRIIDFCVMDVGAKSAERLDEEVIDRILSSANSPPDAQEDNDAHRHIILGSRRLNVIIHSAASCVAGRDEARRIIDAAERVNGASPLVFCGAEIVWECYKGEFPYRDFTVLCAVNSAIGQKTTPQLLRRSLLLARAGGFKTPEAYGKGLCGKMKARPMLTVDELRWTLDKLEERELFSRVQASPRRVYFSKGPREKLVKETTEIVRKKAASKIATRRKEEREAMELARTATAETLDF